MRAAEDGPPPPRFAALRHANFRLFWIGLLISHTGTWMQSVGQGWLIYQLTDTPVWLGISSLAFALPMVVLPLAGGAVADRVNRITLMRGLQLAMAGAALALTAATVSGAVTAWHLAAFSLAQGLSLAFEGPARHAVLPELVHRDSLLSAVSIFQSTYQLAGFFGPALAGMILGVVGTGRLYVLFALNVLTFVVCAGTLSLIRLPQRRADGGSRTGSPLDGLRFVWQHPPLRALLALITISGIFGRSYLVLMPVFARDVLGTDARGLGFLTAAPGVGVILGATVLAAGGVRAHRGRLIITAAVFFAGLLAAFAASHLMALSIPLLVALGCATITLIVTMSTSMQVAAPDALRGRVMSLWAIANVGLPSLGAMLTSSAAALIGAPLAVGAGAGLVALTAVALGRRVRSIA